MVSVTLLAAVIKLPQTAPPTEPELEFDFSSLTATALLSREAERCCERIPFEVLSGVEGSEGSEGGLMGVAGVIDMAGTSRDVSSDKVGFGSAGISSGGAGVGNCWTVRGRGEERTIGESSGRGSDRDLRRGGDAEGGCVTALREGERPRCGLKGK